MTYSCREKQAPRFGQWMEVVMVSGALHVISIKELLGQLTRKNS